MATTVVFDLFSDDPELRAAVAEIKHDPVEVWRLAMFCCQQQLDRALKARGVREHYDAIRLRARETRRQRQANPTPKETP